jgi:hypothetical protein
MCVAGNEADIDILLFSVCHVMILMSSSILRVFYSVSAMVLCT